MDANQRSEFNNQTNNGANEKWTPGSKGNTKSGPLDHTYPQEPNQQQAIRGENDMRPAQDPSRMGQQEVAAEDGSRADHESTLPGAVPDDLPGGSLQSQQTGGSGPQQGITDSHQRQMEQHSGAWGLLEQPVGHRDRNSGTDVNPDHLRGNRQAAPSMNPQDPAHPETQRSGRKSELEPMDDTYQPQGGTVQDPRGNRQTGSDAMEGTGMAIGPQTKQQRREP